MDKVHTQLSSYNVDVIILYITRLMIGLCSSGMTHLRLGNDILSICVMLCDRSLKA